MRELTDQEFAVVSSCKIPYFRNYLQACWLTYSELKDKIEKGEHPDRSELEKLIESMEKQVFDFDYSYLVELEDFSVNPLVAEQRAWKSLSASIKDYIQRFKEYLFKRYSDETQEIGLFIENWWELLQKWNMISNSFECKEFKSMWHQIEVAEGALKDI